LNSLLLQEHRRQKNLPANSILLMKFTLQGVLRRSKTHDCLWTSYGPCSCHMHLCTHIQVQTRFTGYWVY